jgi:hypothetical protein
MADFIQSYGILIFVGLLFGLMLWRGVRGHGMGCCGGGHQPEHEVAKNDGQTGRQGESCH